MVGTRSRLLKGSAWITGGRALTNVLALFSTVVLARILVPNDFGLVALGTTLMAILSSITSVPISEALIQHPNPTAAHFNTAWTISAVRAAIVSLVFACAAWPAARVLHDSRLVGVMVALSATSFLGGLGNPRAIMLTRNLVFWQQFMLQAVQSVISIVFSIGIAVIYRSYWALLLGGLAGQCANIITSYSVLPFRPKPDFRHSRELMSFSIWLTFCQVVNTINWKLDQLIIGSFVGKSSLGFYTIGDNLAGIPTREATAPLLSTLFPAFSNLAGQTTRLTAAYQSAQALATAVALPAGVGLALIADPLVRLTLGQSWIPSIFIIQMLASVYAIQTLGTLAQPLAMASGANKLLFQRDLQGLCLRVPSILVGAYFGGVHGIIYARAIVGTLSIYLTTNVVTRITGLTILQQVSTNVRAYASTIAMAVAVSAIADLFPPSFGPMACIMKIAVMVALGVFVYLSCNAILWTMMGQPKGPEREMLSAMAKLTMRVRRRPTEGVTS